MSFFQAIILGALQGLTELFPISSLGHTVILPAVLGWHINQSDPFFVSFLVITHFATALVLFFFFLPDWIRIIGGFFRSIARRRIEDTYEKLAWLLVIATIPAGLLGLVLQKPLETLFALPAFAALFLMGNGIMLFLAEYLTRRQPKTGEPNDEHVAQLSWPNAFGIGIAECLALLPGFSRTGATLSGGLIVGLNRADAARFSFLLATPIIFAAAVLKLPSLVIDGGMNLMIALAGALAAALFAYISVRFLTHYFKTNSLVPFAGYCVIAGALAFLILH